MNLNSINQAQADRSQTDTYAKKNQKGVSDKTTSNASTSSEAAVYEKNDKELVTDTGYKVDMDAVIAMKEESEARMMDLFRETVKNSTGKQLNGLKGFIASLKSGIKNYQDKNDGVTSGQVIDSETIDAFKALHGDLDIEITDESIAKAQADVAEDGYWGAKAVSDRFVDFAKAVSGGDPAKADMLLEAVKEGYKAAEEIWGSELPQLSQDTLAMTIDKFESWRDDTEVIDA